MQGAKAGWARGWAGDLAISRAPAAGLAAIGLFWGSLAGWLPAVKAAAGVGDARFGVLMMLSAAGGMAAMALAPRLGRRALPVALVVVAGVALTPALAGTPVALGAVLLAVGASMSLADILSNIRIAAIEAHTGRGLQNLNHAMFSLALAAGAALAVPARLAAVPHLWALLPVAAVILALAAVVHRAPPEAAPAAADHPAGRAAPWAAIAPGAAILWLSFMAENGTESWAALHIERTLGLAGGLGAWGPAVFGLTMGLTRLAGQAATRRLGEVRLLALSIAAAAVGAMLLALAPTLTAAVAGAAALGLGVAVVVPTTNTLIARVVPPAQRASAIARAWTIGFTGFFVGPPLVGLAAESLGLPAAIGLIAVMVVLMAPALAALVPRLRPVRAQL